ncbi:MAG: NAD(P)-binding domain-containing protein [bacterium]|nr:NAD(P)-binding domain-containing protein [bacterium]
MNFADLSLIAFYLGPPLLVLGFIRVRAQRRERTARMRLDEAHEAGLLEPPSLHPLINLNRCAGCGSCVRACPENGVLGIIDQRAVLVAPANCIGHGACKTACPMDAITLVFGTATRGVDIPNIGDDFQTNLPGLFIAGELGGMGLIRNAVTQGRQAIENLARCSRASAKDEVDVVIVGAGPAGFAATLAAKKLGLSAVTIEQDTLGGTVAHYPRGKIVMTAPMELPLFGTVKMRETSKEALLELWEEVERKTGIEIRYHERMENIQPQGNGFCVTTNRGIHRARSVLLCVGRRGTPRKLGVPGEELPKVVYRLSDPEQYAGQRVLVVGGGDSALEAAVTLAEEVEGTSVALSYRNPSFGRAKQKNRERVDSAAKSGSLNLLLESTLTAIEPEQVSLNVSGRSIEIENDAVIVCAGGVVPTAFLESIGIEVETKHGTA